MEDRIAQALTNLFEHHRIVFWYDAKKELRDDFEAVSLPDVMKLELTNNEYAIKYQLLREKPEQKFLLYREGPKPDDLDNWLLDVLLAQGEFRTDQVGIWLSELGLGQEYADVLQIHAEYFKAVKRRDAIKRLLEPGETKNAIRLKMLAVCAGSEPGIDTVVENLLQELADDRDDKIKLIYRCGLDGFLWEQMKRCFGYKSEEPGIRDFVIDLFKSCYAMGTNGQAKLTGEALVFLNRWKDSRQFEGSFEKLSDECSEVLGIEQDLSKRDLRELLELDYFRFIDKKIISDMVRAVTSQTVSGGEVALWVRQRRQSHWYKENIHLYEATDIAAQFKHMLSETKLEMDSFVDGIQRYCRSWYKLDQLYRKFIYHMRKASQASLMDALNEQIENLYSNDYLLNLNNRLQLFIDQESKWDASPVPIQKRFFEKIVQPFLLKENKVCVIISDAMRYEIGDELLSLIRQEDRYSGELEPMLAMLPSYTQLGMAALLPNTDISIANNDSGSVEVDGQSSQGTANRMKILAKAITKRTVVLKAEEMMGMKGDDCRALVRDHDVIYVYHNRIDGTGDKMASEERVFEAVEETLQDLILLVKKLNGANVSNMIVTADHGFIYQNRPIDESDFVGDDAKGDQILFRDRRFVFGKGLKDVPGLRKFTSKELGLSGDLEVQIPKSINRLRLKGSGSRFVHGGASLQEIVIPVLKINKKRQSDVSSVDVEIIRGTSSVITSGQLAVVLYQSSPVTDKIRPRDLRAGIYTEAGDLISDRHDLTFDLASENPRERELYVRFVLSRKADEANDQEVILKLEEKHAGTSHYKEYRTLRYQMRRSFTSDFDF